MGFKPNSLEIMPFGLSIGFASKSEDYNKKLKNGTTLTLKKLIIALSGPLTNLIFIVIFLLCPISILKIQVDTIIYSNILIAIFNLIPIYPLDGGRIINCILHIKYGKIKAFNYTNTISCITVSILTAITSIAILYLKNIIVLLILAYLWYLVVRENRKYNKIKKLYTRMKDII